MQNLLLLHGAIGAKDQFNPISEILKENFTLHTLNFSGHGGSELPENFSIERFADDVLDYLNRNAIAQIDIFGFSMGGFVALYLAKHHPERIGRIFTLATKFHWTPDIAWRETKMLDSSKIEEKIPAFAKQLEKRHAPADWKTILQKTAEMMVELGDSNPMKVEDYKTIRHKILIGIGDTDAMVTLDETIAVYQNLPNGSLLVIPETPHPFEKIDLRRLSFEINRFFCD